MHAHLLLVIYTYLRRSIDWNLQTASIIIFFWWYHRYWWVFMFSFQSIGFGSLPILAGILPVLDHICIWHQIWHKLIELALVFKPYTSGKTCQAAARPDFWTLQIPERCKATKKLPVNLQLTESQFCQKMRNMTHSLHELYTIMHTCKATARFAQHGDL